MNKYQETLKFFIKLANRVPLKFANDEFCERFDKNIVLIKELVDRATPKKPINKTKNSNIRYENCDIVICPHCGKKLKLKSKGKYCDKCGGALDWSDEE